MHGLTIRGSITMVILLPGLPIAAERNDMIEAETILQLPDCSAVPNDLLCAGGDVAQARQHLVETVAEKISALPAPRRYLADHAQSGNITRRIQVVCGSDPGCAAELLDQVSAAWADRTATESAPSRPTRPGFDCADTLTMRAEVAICSIEALGSLHLSMIRALQKAERATENTDLMAELGQQAWRDATLTDCGPNESCLREALLGRAREVTSWAREIQPRAKELQRQARRAAQQARAAERVAAREAAEAEDDTTTGAISALTSDGSTAFDGAFDGTRIQALSRSGRDVLLGRFERALRQEKLRDPTVERTLRTRLGVYNLAMHLRYGEVCRGRTNEPFTEVSLEISREVDGTRQVDSRSRYPVLRAYAGQFARSGTTLANPFVLIGTFGLAFDRIFTEVSRDAQRDIGVLDCGTQASALMFANLSALISEARSLQAQGRAPRLFLARCQTALPEIMPGDLGDDVASTCACFSEAFAQHAFEEALAQLEDDFTRDRFYLSLTRGQGLWTEAQQCL